MISPRPSAWLIKQTQPKHHPSSTQQQPRRRAALSGKNFSEVGTFPEILGGSVNAAAQRSRDDPPRNWRILLTDRINPYHLEDREDFVPAERLTLSSGWLIYDFRAGFRPDLIE